MTVVGIAGVPGNYQACAWFVDLSSKTAEVVTPSMPVSSTNSWLKAINDYCQAVGYFTASDGTSHAILARITHTQQADFQFVVQHRIDTRRSQHGE